MRIARRVFSSVHLIVVKLPEQKERNSSSCCRCMSVSYVSGFRHQSRNPRQMCTRERDLIPHLWINKHCENMSAPTSVPSKHMQLESGCKGPTGATTSHEISSGWMSLCIHCCQRNPTWQCWATSLHWSQVKCFDWVCFGCLGQFGYFQNNPNML